MLGSALAALMAASQQSAPSESLGSDVLGGTGSFASATGWVGSNWAVTGGQAVSTASSSYFYRSLGAAMPAGRTWKVTFDVISVSAGSIRAYCGASPTFGAVVSAPGSYTQYITASSGAEAGFLSVGFTGVIDNFVVRQVL